MGYINGKNNTKLPAFGYGSIVLLVIVFIVLKIMGIITWSWLWVI